MSKRSSCGTSEQYARVHVQEAKVLVMKWSLACLSFLHLDSKQKQEWVGLPRVDSCILCQTGSCATCVKSKLESRQPPLLPRHVAWPGGRERNRVDQMCDQGTASLQSPVGTPSVFSKAPPPRAVAPLHTSTRIRRREIFASDVRPD